MNIGPILIYRVIQKESAILWEMILCVILSKKSSYEHGSDFDIQGDPEGICNTLGNDSVCDSKQKKFI